MRFVANFVMQGRRQAIGVCLLGALLPLMHWLSAATVCLVVLRKGAKEGSFVLLWACLPLIVMAATYSDAVPVYILLYTLLGTSVLAFVLRVSQAWELTLIIAMLIAGVGSLAIEFGASELMAALVEHYIRFIGEFQAQVAQATKPYIPTADEAHDLLFGSIAMLLSYFMVILLILARWWQSELFNVGGFGIEFKSLRLSQAFSLVLVLLLVLSFSFSGFVRWIYLLTMPLLMAAIGLVHWTIADKKMSGNWLVSFYLLVIFMFQLMAPILISVALMDSWFDLRKRFRSDREG